MDCPDNYVYNKERSICVKNPQRYPDLANILWTAKDPETIYQMTETLSAKDPSLICPKGK